MNAPHLECFAALTAVLDGIIARARPPKQKTDWPQPPPPPPSELEQELLMSGLLRNELFYKKLARVENLKTALSAYVFNLRSVEREEEDLSGLVRFLTQEQDFDVKPTVWEEWIRVLRTHHDRSKHQKAKPQPCHRCKKSQAPVAVQRNSGSNYKTPPFSLRRRSVTVNVHPDASDYKAVNEHGDFAQKILSATQVQAATQAATQALAPQMERAKGEVRVMSLWKCSVCTFKNAKDDTHCSICNTKQPY